MLIEQTLQGLQKLRLNGMIKSLTQQMDQLELQSLSFEERIALMVDREISERDNKRITGLLRKAKLRQQACVEDIDYRHPRGLERNQIAQLITCGFIYHHHNVFITGPTGCGKSWIACALGQQACRQGLSVRYIRVARLLEDLRIAHADGSYTKLLNQLAKIDLIILDDFGLDHFNQVDRRDLLEIIEDRHKLKSTLITSQLAVKHWHDYIGEPTIADAILDRLFFISYKIELEGGSMRKTEKID
jgi:DNA replication protein DnaC